MIRSSMRWYCLLAAGCVAAIMPCAGWARTWKDSTGQFSVEAEFVKIEEDKVYLKRADGQVKVVPLARLSEADQQYAKSQSKPAKQAPAAKTKPSSTSSRPAKAATGLKVGRLAIEQELPKRTPYEFSEAPLSKVIDYFANAAQVQFFVDKQAFEEAEILRDARVTAASKTDTLESALDAILGPLKLVWLIRHDVLWITTPELAETLLETRVYQLARPVAKQDVALKQIMSAASPKSWDSEGGPGSISLSFPLSAVIAQTYRNHRLLEQKLGAEMRPVALAPSKAAKRAARGRPDLSEILAQPAVCDFVDTPLAEAMQSLAEKHQVKITLDERKARPDSPVTFRLGGLPLESVLTLLLRSRELIWTVRQDELLVTSQELEESKAYEATYDVRDLVLALRGKVDPLQEIICRTLHPATWNPDVGLCKIEAVGGGAGLKIKQTYRVHRDIERLLADLRMVGRR